MASRRDSLHKLDKKLKDLARKAPESGELISILLGLVHDTATPATLDRTAVIVAATTLGHALKIAILQRLPRSISDADIKPGSRNKRTEALWGDLEADADYIDHAHYLASVVSDPKQPAELRVAAANYLLPYKYSKCGPTLPLRYVEEPIQLPFPHPATIAESRVNIAFLTDLKAQGRLDLDTADGLISDQKVTVGILIEEARIEAQHPDPNKPIHITGGLPPLPGCDVIMDDTPYGKNRHANGKTIDHIEPPTLTNSVVSEASE